MHSFTLLKTWLSQLLLTKQLEYGIFQVTVLQVLVLFYGSYSLVLIALSLCTPVNWIREWQKMRNTVKVLFLPETNRSLPCHPFGLVSRS